MWETALFCNNIYCLLLTCCPDPPRQPPSRAHGDAVAAAVPRSLRVPAAHGAAHQRPSLGCQQPPGTISAPLTLHPSVLRRPALGRGGRWAPTVLRGHPRTPVPPPARQEPPSPQPQPSAPEDALRGLLGLAGISERPRDSKACRTVLVFCLHSFLLSAFQLCLFCRGIMCCSPSGFRFSI